ncbi:hypothetical protein [Micromonospora sp. KC606]|uniref:hypothetical protein n=1 Tax=Micromonospora sp. KC606 TaxID=2530379 RepID=UPI001FB7411E|nr:hypothetical protein [Micromonospora sp. KC606]
MIVNITTAVGQRGWPGSSVYAANKADVGQMIIAPNGGGTEGGHVRIGELARVTG